MKALVAGLAMSCASLGAPAALAQPTPPDAALHKPFWGKRLIGYLVTRDGTRLRYSVLLPRGDGPFPTIVNYSGYDPGAIGGSAYLADDTAMSVNLDRALVESGYAVFGVNARGTGCSEGQFDFLGPDYGRDGRDAIEFIATQSWSNKAVGMANWSWAGMSQLATASERPPHLKAIAPGMVLGDARLDSWAPGGVPAPAFVAHWWDYLHSRWASIETSARVEDDSACLAQLGVNRRTAEPGNLSSVIIRHPLRDAFIEQRNLAARVANIAVPILSMTSFQDEAVTSRDGHYQDRVDPELLWQVQTNGGHDLYESRHFRETLLAFFDRFVKGEANGFERGPRLRLWMETTSAGTGHAFQEAARPRWTVERTQVSPDVRAVHFALASGGRLVADGTGAGSPDGYTYPVPGPAINVDFDADRWGDMDAGWRRGSLAYTSAPLARDLVSYGTASADLWLASTATDTDVQVTLSELRPDGQEVFVQRGWLRLSNRAQDDGRATALRPFPLDRPETMAAMTPGKPVLGRVELPKFAHPFRAGSRVRIWIDAPSRFGGYGFAPLSAPATNSVWHDAAHRSQLVIGELVDAKAPTDRPACGTILKQPCRRDPLSTRR